MSSTTRRALLALTLCLVIFPLTVGKPGLPPTLKADEPAYYLAALSLWHDADLRVELQDIQRLFDEYPFDNRNLILMSDDGWHSAYFGKPHIYSLLAAPWAGLFGANGLVGFNMALMLGMVWLGSMYLSRHNPDPLAALYAAGFFLLSSGFAYVFWLQPELLNMAAVMACLYLGLSDGRAQSRWTRWLALPWLRAALSGVALPFALYNKPMLVALGLAVVARFLIGRRWRELAAWLLAAAGCSALIAGSSMLLTGHPSAYLGVERYGVSVSSALELPYTPRPEPAQQAQEQSARPPSNSFWWALRIPTRDEVTAERMLENLVSFGIGRHTGLFVYMPFAALSLLLFLAFSWRSATRWVLLLGLSMVMLYLLIWIEFNWHGGGGFVGNRYFVNAYPAFLFLVTRIRPAWSPLLGYLAGGVLVGPLVFTPFGAPVPHPTLQAHVRNWPYGELPRELTLREIPGYRGRVYGDVWFSGRNDVFKPLSEEMWLHGGTKVELVLKRGEPIEALVLRLRNHAPDNLVRVSLEGNHSQHRFGPAPPREGEGWELEIAPRRPWKVHHERGVKVWVYRLEIDSASGVNPAWLYPGVDSFHLGVALRYLGTPEQLRRDVYHLQLQLESSPEQVRAGEEFELSVQVSNTSQVVWPGSGELRVSLAYHWLDQAGAPLVWDGRRTPLGADLEPGGTLRLEQLVVAPAEPGRYTLVLDPVYENVAWFSERGVEPLGLPLTVTPAADDESP